ncbi:Uncharacterised protein [uncultured archaeon]|nr:Uncharacterised protein [uncultured archaeon]
MKRNFIAMFVVGAFVASMMLSAGFIDSVKASGLEHSIAENASKYNGFLYEESSIIRGSGDISIKGSFSDRAMDSAGWMKGTGSISFESQRSMNKICQSVDFTQKSDLVFQGRQLKNRKLLESPLFERRSGARVNERFDLSHVDQSETEMIRSLNRFDNTLVYNTSTAFEGMWDIKNVRGSLFHMNKGEELYSGSFQTQKNIEFSDSEKS